MDVKNLEVEEFDSEIERSVFFMGCMLNGLYQRVRRSEDRITQLEKQIANLLEENRQLRRD